MTGMSAASRTSSGIAPRLFALTTKSVAWMALEIASTDAARPM
jgi:hypothetical protein